MIFFHSPKFFKIFVLLLIGSNIQALSLPEPYTNAEILPFDGSGWFWHPRIFDKWFSEEKIETVIEVGCWMGSSTRCIAKKLGSKGKIYAVDTWLGSPDEECHLNHPKLSQIYEVFLSNVIHEKLTDFIVPVRMDSILASQYLDIKTDLIYIDASHIADAVYQDIIHWYPHLNKWGVFCGDDWCCPSVREGVEKAANDLFLKIEYGNNWWRLWRKAA